ncbi:nucleotide exchange factor GrpE [Kitasatospora sp. NPDC101176]|uniref:nucleotide exchange factor GrpE n=1 Tax=Kitasatospora sp. NPDC101176 TaxID=3364099 RepID=UPI003822E2AB
MTDAPTDVPTADPIAGPADGLRPLDVPQRALEVDLDQAFSQLLFRASLLQRLRAEEAQTARATQRDLLGILVEVDDALASLGLDQELVLLGRGAGIEATRRRLLGRLAKAGVRPMRLEGLAADPALTEIVGVEPRAGVAPETVLRTVITGFFWGEEVLRRAQVVVAAPPGPDPAPEPVHAADTGGPGGFEGFGGAGATEDPGPADPATPDVAGEPAPEPGPEPELGPEPEPEPEQAAGPGGPGRPAVRPPARRKGAAAGARRRRKK